MPLFVHSLFRSGSTYIFQAFRRATRDGSPRYTAYQEPIHEIAINSRDSPSALLSLPGSGEGQRALRHPPMSEPYFKELYDAYSAWHDVIDEKIVYADYFGLCAIDKTAAYLHALISASPRRPVLQECRTTLRMGRLKQRLGGVHIYLWRNPWDQWWSLKATDYFDIAHQVILNAPAVPPAISALRHNIGFEGCADSAIAKQFAYFGCRRPPPDLSYLTFFTLWSLALVEARRNADIDINIDLLSVSKEYRALKLAQLGEVGIDGIDFSDSHIPQAPFGASDELFFRPLEQRVNALLSQGGVSDEDLSSITELRAQAAPPVISKKDRGLRAETELYRLREVARRIEFRESAQSVHWIREVASANKRGQWLENEWNAAKAALEYQANQWKAEIQSLTQALSIREQELADQLSFGESESGRMSRLLASREHELSVNVSGMQLEIQQLTEKLVAREHQLGSLLALKQDELQQLTATLANREHELESRLGLKQDELQRVTSTLAAREYELGSLLARKQDELQQLTTSLASREREMGSQLARKQDELQRLTSTLVGHEKLRAQADLKQRELQRIASNLGAREHELSIQLGRKHEELQQLTATLAAQEHSFSTQLGRKQDELQQLTATVAAQEHSFAAQLGQKQDELQQLTATLAAREHELSTQLGRIQEELAASLARGQWLENEWNAAKAKIHELNYHSHTWWLKADAASRDLQTVFASRSWRITAPLRNSQHFVSRCRRKVRTSTEPILDTTRHFAGRTFRRGLDFCNAHPRVKAHARQFLNLFPRLDTRIRAFLPGDNISAPTLSPEPQIQVIPVAIQTAPPIQQVASWPAEDGIRRDLREAVRGWKLGGRVDA